MKICVHFFYRKFQRINRRDYSTSQSTYIPTYFVFLLSITRILWYRSLCNASSRQCKYTIIKQFNFCLIFQVLPKFIFENVRWKLCTHFFLFFFFLTNYKSTELKARKIVLHFIYYIYTHQIIRKIIVLFAL